MEKEEEETSNSGTSKENYGSQQWLWTAKQQLKLSVKTQTHKTALPLRHTLKGREQRKGQANEGTRALEKQSEVYF